MRIIKITSMIVILNLSIWANEYFSKAQPLEIYNIKSAVSGKIIYINDSIKGSKVTNATIVKIDSKVDKVELKQTKNKIKRYKEIIKIEKGTLKKFEKIKSKSQVDKDNQKIKVLNIENQLSDLIVKKTILEDKIDKKLLVENKRYISSINVKVGDFVNPGTLLYTADDLSKAKLEIFLPIHNAKMQSKKTIYINGKKTTYKINKLYKVADTKHISSYKCEIIIDKPKNFSKLVKIEFK
jgi:hypothetical protein